MKKQTSVAEKQYQKLESNKKEEKVRKSRVKSIYTTVKILFFTNIITVKTLLTKILLIQKQLFKTT